MFALVCGLRCLVCGWYSWFGRSSSFGSGHQPVGCAFNELLFIGFHLHFNMTQKTKNKNTNKKKTPKFIICCCLRSLILYYFIFHLLLLLQLCASICIDGQRERELLPTQIKEQLINDNSGSPHWHLSSSSASSSSLLLTPFHLSCRLSIGIIFISQMSVGANLLAKSESSSPSCS